MRSEASTRPGITVMVGDGVNDASALAAADLGVAMGARGATASSDAADVVLIVDRLDRPLKRRPRVGIVVRRDGVAVMGVLTPVSGAIAQEVIDVLAVANALRPLRRPRSVQEERTVPDSWSHQLAEADGPLRLVLEEVRSVAIGLDHADETTALTSLQGVTRRISEEIVPHERADESQIYPDVADRLGGDDPLAPMSRTHEEFFHLSSLLSGFVDDATEHGFDLADRGEARRILYSLDAILRLHFAQEELLTSIALGDAETVDRR